MPVEHNADYCCPGLSVLASQVSENDRLYMKLFEASDQRVVTAMTAAKEAMQTALLVVKEASERTDTATEKRFDEMAEKIDTLRDALSKQITDATSGFALAAGRRGGANALWGYLVGAVGLGGVIFSIIAALTMAK